MPLESFQNGRYRIARPLGSGSMGEVYLVDDTRIDRQVAIKVIRFDASSFMNADATQDAIRLFEREAKSIAQLNHPNILPLFDYGEEMVNGTTVTYMVMPYSPDGSLSTWLQQHAHDDMLAPQDTFHFIRQAADALQHAHDHDIIHQDVKPSNFLLRKRNGGLPDILLADFGIAKLAASTSGASHVVRGTPIYMAPEQWEGHPVPASDQYALAVMAYQLLTGRTPFQGGPSQMMYQHMTVSPLPPSTVNTALSPAVDTVLLRALAKRPQERFPSVIAFADALQQTLPTIDHPTIINSMGHSQYDDNRPTMMSAANLAQDDAIRATLAISLAEAANGTNRALTLPGGQRITVSVPPGVQNGQVLRIGKQEGTLINGNLVDSLLLTIAVAPGYNAGAAGVARDDRTIINADSALIANANQPTVQDAALNTLSSQPTVLQQHYPPVATQGNMGQFGPPVQPMQQIPPQQTVPPRKSSTGRIIFLVAIVVIILLASTGFLIYFLTNNAATNNANATATAQANGALAGTNTALAQANQTGTALAGNGNATATANANATAIGIGNVHATATANAIAQANATATANAQGNANATATAQANVNATATAQANATATATAHPVISNGTGTIQGTFQFSFDSGTQVSSNGDVWWNQIDSTQRQMVPQGSATIVNLGSVDFNALNFTDLQGESYGTTPIDGNNDSSNLLINGDVFAVHTNGGNYAKVLVVAYGYNIQIQWVTYHG
ncbi:MAG TPA: protein kinase [Ktedonobacteraceae bacterium]|nr:protein kinase [Ktedonobacteraceae bacterium]